MISRAVVIFGGQNVTNLYALAANIGLEADASMKRKRGRIVRTHRKPNALSAQAPRRFEKFIVQAAGDAMPLGRWLNTYQMDVSLAPITTARLRPLRAKNTPQNPDFPR